MQVHELGVLHGDLALRNMVLSRSRPGQAMLVDFSHAELVADATEWRGVEAHVLLEDEKATLRQELGMPSSSDGASPHTSITGHRMAALPTGRGPQNGVRRGCPQPLLHTMPSRRCLPHHGVLLLLLPSAELLLLLPSAALQPLLPSAALLLLLPSAALLLLLPSAALLLLLLPSAVLLLLPLCGALLTLLLHWSVPVERPDLRLVFLALRQLPAVTAVLHLTATASSDCCLAAHLCATATYECRLASPPRCYCHL